MMQLSEIGGHLTARTGIDDLMEDLFKALHSGDAGLCQLNGGSPAVIPEVTELWRRSMGELVRNGKFDVLVGHYAHPGGDPAFIRALVRFLNERCGWNLTPGKCGDYPGRPDGLLYTVQHAGGPVPGRCCA